MMEPVVDTLPWSYTIFKYWFGLDWPFLASVDQFIESALGHIVFIITVLVIVYAAYWVLRYCVFDMVHDILWCLYRKARRAILNRIDPSVHRPGPPKEEKPAPKTISDAAAASVWVAILLSPILLVQGLLKNGK